MSSTYLLISNSATYTVINNGMFDFDFIVAYLSLKTENVIMKIETILIIVYFNSIKSKL